MRNRRYIYQLIKELEPRYLLFLTATLIHNKLEDFYNLADLVRSGFFGVLRISRRSTKRSKIKVGKKMVVRNSDRFFHFHSRLPLSF